MKRFVLFFICIKLYAGNNPGFMGHRNVVSAQCQFRPLMAAVTGQTSRSFGLFFERSYKRSASLEFGYSQYTQTINTHFFHSMNSYGAEYKMAADDKPLEFSGSGEVVHRVLSIAWKKYLRGMGAIAPMGYYVGMIINRNHWSHKNTDYKAIYYESGSPVFTMIPTDKARAVNMTEMGFSLGNRKVFGSHFCVDVAVSAGFIVRSNLPYKLQETQRVYSNVNDYVNVYVAKSCQRKQLLGLHAGVGYLF